MGRSQSGFNGWSWITRAKATSGTDWATCFQSRLTEFSATLLAQQGAVAPFLQSSGKKNLLYPSPPKQASRKNEMHFSLTAQVSQRADLI